LVVYHYFWPTFQSTRLKGLIIKILYY
jgi:hypothetical protein